MRGVPWWGVVSSAAAPVLLVGGWTVAAGLQRRPFDPVAETVSGLMAVGATDRWVMTTALLAVGVCYIVTGAALRSAASAGRLVLIAGAAAGMLVAANPEPAAGGGTVSHAVWAALGLAGLAAWPAGAWRRGSPVPWGLRPGVCFGAIVVEVILLAWFVAELITRAGQAGLAERAVGAEQALWPLVVVLSCRAQRGPLPATPRRWRALPVAAPAAWPGLPRSRRPGERPQTARGSDDDTTTGQPGTAGRS